MLMITWGGWAIRHDNDHMGVVEADCSRKAEFAVSSRILRCSWVSMKLTSRYPWIQGFVKKKSVLKILCFLRLNIVSYVLVYDFSPILFDLPNVELWIILVCAVNITYIDAQSSLKVARFESFSKRLLVNGLNKWSINLSNYSVIMCLSIVQLYTFYHTLKARF